MHNHKIFDVLKSFDSKRLKRFADFLNSPYPKKSPKAVSLGVRLTAFYPDFDAGKLDEELAYKAFESQKAFSKHELVRYLSLLLTLAEDFIAIESLEKSSYLKGSLITEYYYETKNDAGLKRTIKQNEKKLNTTLFIDSTNYFYSYLNQKASFNYSWQ